jgi:hypothetical protein
MYKYDNIDSYDDINYDNYGEPIGLIEEGDVYRDDAFSKSVKKLIKKLSFNTSKLERKSVILHFFKNKDFDLHFLSYSSVIVRNLHVEVEGVKEEFIEQVLYMYLDLKSKTTERELAVSMWLQSELNYIIESLVKINHIRPIFKALSIFFDKQYPYIYNRIKQNNSRSTNPYSNFDDETDSYLTSERLYWDDYHEGLINDDYEPTYNNDYLNDYHRYDVREKPRYVGFSFDNLFELLVKDSSIHIDSKQNFFESLLIFSSR